MELMIFDSRKRASGFFRGEIDMEIGDSDALNDFVVDDTVSMGDYVAEIGGEFGGIVERVDHDSEYSYTGHTWRGLLNQWIIMPSNGPEKELSTSDLNDILRITAAGVLGGFFCVTKEKCGVEVDDYTFPDYCTVLEGIMGLCAAHRCKLVIRNIVEDKKLKVELSIKRREDKKLSESYFEAETTLSNMGVNHLICVGKDEETPEVVHLYMWPDGTVRQTQYYFGFKERQAVYQCSKSDVNEIIESGTKQLKKLCSYKKMDVKTYYVDADIGDYLEAKKDGMIVKETVVRKVLSGENGTYHVEVQTKGEENGV